jgi:hypothetical protein
MPTRPQRTSLTTALHTDDQANTPGHHDKRCTKAPERHTDDFEKHDLRGRTTCQGYSDTVLSNPCLQKFTNLDPSLSHLDTVYRSLLTVYRSLLLTFGLFFFTVDYYGVHSQIRQGPNRSLLTPLSLPPNRSLLISAYRSKLLSATNLPAEVY